LKLERQLSKLAADSMTMIECLETQLVGAENVCEAAIAAIQEYKLGYPKEKTQAAIEYLEEQLQEWMEIREKLSKLKKQK